VVVAVRIGKWGLLVMAVGIGCSRSQAPWEIVHPASGTVTFGGKAIVGAQVTLCPLDSTFPEAVRPTAVTQADGKFQLSTYKAGDGAPSGDYKVTVIWHPLVDGEGGAVRGANALPVRYATPESSDLSVNIPEGGATLPVIDLVAQ